MQLKALLPVFLLSTSGAFSAPTHNENPFLDERAKGFMNLYTGSEYDGAVDVFYTEAGGCQNVPRNDAYNSVIIVNARCYFFEHINCQGRSALLSSGHGYWVSWRMREVWQNLPMGETWNNRISSVFCWNY